MSVATAEGERALEQLRTIVAGLPEVTERKSHHTPTFFIRDKKVLVHLWEDHHSAEGIYLWCPAPPGVQGELVELEPERFFVPAYVGHRGWIGVMLDGDVDWDEITEILYDAYRVTAPKTLVRVLEESLRDP